MFGLATYAGTLQADAHFHNAILRLYELSPDAKSGDTHRKDGPFEVWTWPFYPILGHAHEYGERQFVESYNRRMRIMYAHPEEFAREGVAIDPGVARPSSQPAQLQP
jgi:hypothetical protein